MSNPTKADLMGCHDDEVLDRLFTIEDEVEAWKARAEQAEAERDELIEMIRFWYDELSTGGAGACALPASMLCVLEEAQQEGGDE